jgi:hypothetical protein
MAKSSVASKGFSFLDLDKELSKISGFETGSILANNTFSEVDEWISTGNYLLNAQISGTLFGGIPNTRSLGVMGDPGCLQKNEKVKIYKLKSKNLVYERNFLSE